MKTKLTKLFVEFFESEQASGVILILCTITSIIFANSYFGEGYSDFWHTKVGFEASGIALKYSIEHWINDGLMAVFFLLIGLEIERELYIGELSDLKNATLPIFAAVGGMVTPAILYYLCNLGTETQAGVGIPMATDIAFALGVLSLLGSRVPVSLKVFLTALAILDDLGAILIIALFYSSGLDWMALLGAGLTLFMMIVLNRLHVMRPWPYLILAGGVWWFMLHSGVHATIAGVAAAMTIPVKRTPGTPEARDSPLHVLEHFIQPYVAFLVLPVFGFVNAGVALSGLDPKTLTGPAPLGVATGLFFGKQIGVF